MNAPIPLRIGMEPGLPAARTPGQFLGFDATGAMWLLRWSRQYEEWHALGFAHDLGPAFPKLRRGAELTPHIIGHVRGPEFQPEAPPMPGLPPHLLSPFRGSYDG